MIITAVKDLKADSFLQPQFSRSIADVTRAWEIVVNEGESLISRFPNDFALYHIGNFDSATGVITVLDRHHLLGIASEFVRAPKADTPLPFPRQSQA